MMKRVVATILIFGCVGTIALAQQGAELSTEIAGEMLEQHNIWRRPLQLVPLNWSNDLAQSAREWSSQLALNGCNMSHSGIQNVGENLFWRSPEITTWSNGREERTVSKVTPGQVVNFWGDEVQWYDYNTNTCSAPAGKFCGHYTQVVWANTTEVGCAMAVCPDSAQIWTCQYRPAGNVIGQKPY